MLRIRSRDERGAVLFIVAVSMVALLGMLVLTVDLGGMVMIKRRMVNASDSAALAAAQACAGQEVVQGGFGVAEMRADQYAASNDAASNTGATNIIDSQGCGTLSTGYVRVRYRRDVGLFFAPIFGQNQGSVVSTATATWEPALGASPIPLRLTLQPLLPCVTGDVGARCYFGFDNSDANSQAASQWGWLNFPEGWNTTSCTTNAGGTAELKDYIAGTGPAFNAVLNVPPPTYVCAGPGEIASGVIELERRVGDLLTFPVIDPVTYPINLTPGNESYPVVGFTVLRLANVWRGRQARVNCPDLGGANNASLFCLELEWAGPQVGGTIPGGPDAPDFGLRAVRLTE